MLREQFGFNLFSGRTSPAPNKDPGISNMMSVDMTADEQDGFGITRSSSMQGCTLAGISSISCDSLDDLDSTRSTPSVPYRGGNGTSLLSNMISASKTPAPAPPSEFAVPAPVTDRSQR